MPEYATITVQVTEHGDDLIGVDAELSARPLTQGAMLSYPAEPERLSVGTWKAGPNSDGSINLQIPIDTFQNPAWRFDLRLKGGSQPVNIPLGTYYITESAALPRDLVNIDVTSVSPDLVASVAQYAADAQAAAESVAAIPTTTDALIEGRINDPTSATSVALAATIASEVEPVVTQVNGRLAEAALAEKFGESALQDFVAKCEAGNADVHLLIFSDSTAAAGGGWVDRAIPQLAARFPHLSVAHRKWADGSPGSYAAAVTTTGTGSRTLTVWNASVAGKTWQYHLDATRWPMMIAAVNADAVVISLGHNDNPAALHTNNTPPQRAKALVHIEFLRTILPSAAVVLMSQNPLLVTNQTAASQYRADMLRSLARVRGFGFIDVCQAFVADGRPMTELVSGDNVHPTAAGYALWAERFMAEVNVRPTGHVTGQSAPSFTVSPANLIGDPTFKNYDGSAIPTGWTFGNLTHTRDTSVFETAGGSLSATKAAGGSVAYIDYVVPAVLGKGRVVTALARLYVPASSPGLTGQVTIRYSSGSPGSETWGIYDQWFWRSMTALAPPTSTTLAFRLMVDPTSGSALQNVKVDRVALLVGELPMDPYVP